MKWIASILRSGDKELSSKRFCGILGWIVILICYTYCCITGQHLPDMGELLMACVTLLGVDSVADVFKSKYQSRNETNNNNKNETSNETDTGTA